MTTLTLVRPVRTQVAVVDQDRMIQRVATVFLVLMFALGAYAVLGIQGRVPLPSWSPVQVQRTHDQHDRFPEVRMHTTPKAQGISV